VASRRAYLANLPKAQIVPPKKAVAT